MFFYNSTIVVPQLISHNNVTLKSRTDIFDELKIQKLKHKQFYRTIISVAKQNNLLKKTWWKNVSL